MKKHIPSLLFLLAAIIWGFAFPIQKELEMLPPFTIGSIRYLLAAAFLLLVIPLLDLAKKNKRGLFSQHGSTFSENHRKKKPMPLGLFDFTRGELIGGAVCGSVLAIASALQQSGMGEGTDAGKAAFITALYVLIVPVISLLLGKRSPIHVWICVGIAVVGFWLLCVKDNLTVEFSDLLVLICSVVFSLHIIVIDRFSPGCDGVRLSCIQFFTAFVVCTPISLVANGLPDFSLIFSYLPHLLYFGVCSGGIAYTLQVVGQGMDGVNPAVASIILSMESVFGAVGGAILRGEVMSPKEYAGCAVVLLAVIISQLDVKAITERFRKKAVSKCEKGTNIADK